MSITYYIKTPPQVVDLEYKPFASGGEGLLYQVSKPNTWRHCVAKIIYPHKRTSQKEAKLLYLLEHPPCLQQQPSISWVQELLYDKEGSFVGFLMPHVTGEKLEILTSSKLPKHLGVEWQRLCLGNLQALRLRLKICYNIALVVHRLHATNRYVLVDLKPDNLLVKSDGTVSIVDTDSVEIIENNQTLFAATVATPEYTPSEYYRGIRPGEVNLDTSWDNFGLAVIFYRLLFGIHPFAATANAPYDQLVSLGDKIKAGLFVHNVQHQQDFKVIPPPHQVFYEQESALQMLFQQAFVAGHKEPHKRPDASTWTKVIADHFLLLTTRKLPVECFSLKILEGKDWYEVAIKQAYENKNFINKKTTSLFQSTRIRKPFKKKIVDNFWQLWHFCRLGMLILLVFFILNFLFCLVLFLGVGIGESDMIFQFLWAALACFTWFVKSPFLILILFFPLLKAVFTQTKETFFLDSTWNEKSSIYKTQEVITGRNKDIKERQYDLYTERSRLRNKIRELKNEHHVYLRIKQQKEADFGKLHHATIAHSNRKIEQQLQSQEANLLEKEKYAKQLLQQEAKEIRQLLQKQQRELEADPVFGTIDGKDTAQKLFSLQQNPLSRKGQEDVSIEAIHNALTRVHHAHELAKEVLRKNYDVQHQVLLDTVQEVKTNIDTLVGTSVRNLHERIRIDELLFDKGFWQTLTRMEQIQAEIELHEIDLQAIKDTLNELS